MLEKVLVTTDFSDQGRLVYPAALYLARELGTEIHLAHVVSPVPPLYYEEVWVDISDERYYQNLSQRLESEASSEIWEGVRVHPHLLVGEPPHRQLVDFAATEGMGLILLSTHGRTGLGHALLGSFAEKVIRSSPVPVYTCRLAQRGTWRPPKNVLVPWDFSESATAVFPLVRTLSERFGCQFTFLHVFEPHYAGFEGFPSQAMIDAVRRIEDEAPLQAELRFGEIRAREIPKVDARFEWTSGVPYREIVERAARENHDLIVLATHGRTGWRHVLLGSVAERVTRHAPCPVLTVRPPTSTDRERKENAERAEA